MKQHGYTLIEFIVLVAILSLGAIWGFMLYTGFELAWTLIGHFKK